MSSYWITKKPMTYMALGASILGLGACSSTGGGNTSASDYSYTEIPSEEANAQSQESFEGLGLFSDGDPAMFSDAGNENLGTTSQNKVAAKTFSGTPYRLSRFPEIASRPVNKDGYSMNGYVFVRNERTWQDVSQLIYGRSDRAQLLASWNAGASPQPGAVVYYNSPIRPDDTQSLKSFDADFGFEASGFLVEPGDTLSLVSGRVFGSAESWREIASLNQDLLAHPDRIEVGQTLRLPSKIRDNQVVLQAYIAAERERAAEELALSQASQTPQADQVEDRSAQEVVDSVGSQAPPLDFSSNDNTVVDDTQVSVSTGNVFEAASELSPTVQLGVMFVALLLIALVASVIIRRRKSGEKFKPADLLNLGKKKTGTDD